MHFLFFYYYYTNITFELFFRYYHFHLQDPQDPAHQFAKEHTFEEWLEVSPAAQNEMTKCLSGIRSEFSPSKESFEMAKVYMKIVEEEEE